MVVTIAWTQSWIAVSVSLGVLLLLLLFLLGCLCYEREQQQLANGTSRQQYYMLDENGIKRLAPDAVDCALSAGGGFFRRFSNAGVLRTNFRVQHHAVQNELLDSLDIDKQFSNSVLQLVSEKKHHLDVGDDWKSCQSEGSHFSGIQNRRGSTDSMGSIMSEPNYFRKS